MPVLPMFPLGSVLLPGVFLPLHIFEPRYRALVHDCLAGDHEFGVVLIDRGSEVGGGETRTRVGTVARIIEAVEMADGRWALGAVGMRRLRVTAWLDDQPYPRAEIEAWPDPAPDGDLTDVAAAVVARLRRVLARRSELGDTADATPELDPDPVAASYQVVALAGFGPADQQRLLEVPDARQRLARLLPLLADEEDLLGRRLLLESRSPVDEELARVLDDEAGRDGPDTPGGGPDRP